MRKREAIEQLGGTTSAAAAAVGVSYQAVVKWPDPLPRRIEDRVLAALYRRALALTGAEKVEARRGNGKKKPATRS